MGIKTDVAKSTAKVAGKGTKAWAITMTCVAAVATGAAVAVPVVMVTQQSKSTTEKFKITFNSNGGSEVKEQEVEKSKTGVEPAVPTKNGFEFKGWCTDEGLTQVFDWTTPITTNITLYAKWEDVVSTRTCKVKFDLGGAELIGGSLNRNITQGTSFNQINCPSFKCPAGKKFSKWSVNDNFIINDSENETVISAIYEDITAENPAKHKLNFIYDGNEQLYGSQRFDIDMGKSWRQVLSDPNFPIITLDGYIEDDFRIPPLEGSSDVTILDQDYVFSATEPSCITININWRKKEEGKSYGRIIFLIDEADKHKGNITSGYRTYEYEKGVEFKKIDKPIVTGYPTGSGQYYTTNGWKYKDENGSWVDWTDSDVLDKDYVVIYPKFGETSVTDRTIVLEAGEYGEFKSGQSTTKTIQSEPDITFAKFKEWADANKPTIKDEYKSKYEFYGWAINDTDVVPIGTTKISAVYSCIDTCYVIFAGGDDVSITGSQAFQVTKGTLWSDFASKNTLPIATRTGYTFKNWLIDGGSAPTASYPINTSIVLYPEWNETTAIYNVVPSIESTYGTVSATKTKFQENSTWGDIKSNFTYTPSEKYIGLNDWQTEDGTILTDDYKITANIKIKPLYDLLINRCVKATVTQTTKFYCDDMWVSANVWLSTDAGESWTKLNNTMSYMEISAGSTVYLKGKNTSTIGALQFITGEVSLSGNVTTLIDYTKINSKIYGSAFYRLFLGSTGIKEVDSEFIQCTTTASSCFQSMFNGCTNLVSAPFNLYSEVVAENAYCEMFMGCTSLVFAPAIYAKQIDSRGCLGMFQQCTKLPYITKFAPTKLSEYACQSMFAYCTSLTSTTYLPATTLAKACYASMYVGCTDLKYAHELPAKNAKQSCYSRMFKDCTSLVTAPIVNLENSARECCAWMFEDCTNLATYPSEINFTGGTTTDDTYYCYAYMFRKCKSLKSFPKINLINIPSSLTINNNTFIETFAIDVETKETLLDVGYVEIGRESEIPEDATQFITWPSGYTTQLGTFMYRDYSQLGDLNTMRGGYTYWYKLKS